jgi:hypothetical protein
MMYKNFMVFSLKSGGKILREKGDSVLLPFGSEYSIYLKNLQSRKAQVKIEIDGEDVLDSKYLLINPNDTFELEGFLKDIVARNKFKFIKKTPEISDFRGDRIDDGIIRVSFYYEKEKPVVQEVKTIHTHEYKSYYSYSPIWYTTSDSLKFNDTQIYCSSNVNNINPQNCLRNMSIGESNAQTYSVPVSLNNFEDGITVHGAEIEQKFKYGYIGELEDIEHIIILRLQGYTAENKKVSTPLLVSDKLQCKVCGKISKSDAKYCGNCGTFLDIDNRI